MYVGESGGHGTPKGYDEAEEEVEVFKKSHSGCGPAIVLYFRELNYSAVSITTAGLK